MTAGPLVSTIITTRDRPELAARAVSSALAQTYPEIEVLLVDDGSSPRLTLPAELAEDPRVRTIRFEVAGGPGAARNRAAKQSRGSLLAFLDDDDQWRPGKIARQVEVLEGAGPRVAGVDSGYDLWDGGSLVLRFLPRPDRDLARTLLERPCLQPSTILLRRGAFETTGGFDTHLRRIEDWELWVRLSDSYQVMSLPEVHVDRRASDTSPGELLHWYRELVRIIEPRLELLAPAERDRIRATHALEEGALLIRLGRDREARARIREAWRSNRRAWRPPAYLARTLVGERAWSAGKRVVRVTAHPLARALGNDPLVRSW